MRILLAVLAFARCATSAMPVAQQNALVEKYCAVCHTDASKNGGLSLQHFDAAQAPPSLLAMLLSKLTGGVSLETVRGARSNPAASAIIDRKMKTGAMGAAGIPIPDKSTIDALIDALAARSAGAAEWSVEGSPASALTASILREAPSASPGEAEFYRLIASCDSATREGSIQLTWSPIPQSGALTASVDGNPARQYRVEGSESMGNGSGLVLRSLASVVLAPTFPAESLTITDLFPGQTVVFPFASLPADARRQLRLCFPL